MPPEAPCFLLPSPAPAAPHLLLLLLLLLPLFLLQHPPRQVHALRHHHALCHALRHALRHHHGQMHCDFAQVDRATRRLHAVWNQTSS